MAFKITIHAYQMPANMHKCISWFDMSAQLQMC